MNETLISAGEFASLARTTKRTILFYDQKKILKPAFIDSKKFRFYKPEQIIDFQIILLLRKLNFTIEEIQNYLNENNSNNSLKNLFISKREEVLKQIEDLNRNLETIDNYYKNLDENGILIKPEIKTQKSFEIYFIEKIGQYSKIKNYCLELKSYFKEIPEDSTFLTIFEEDGFNPENAKMKIGVIIQNGMTLKVVPTRSPHSGDSAENINIVKIEKIQEYKALSFTHHGSGKLLSLIWKYLNKYFIDKKMIADSKNIYSREFYKLTSLNGEDNEDKHIFEIQIPIH